MTQETQQKLSERLAKEHDLFLTESDLRAIENIILGGLQDLRVLEKPLKLIDENKYTHLIKRSEISGIRYKEFDFKGVHIQSKNGFEVYARQCQNEETLENFIQDFKDGF